MLNITRRYKISILTILTILSFSTFVPALAFAAPLQNSAKDWQNVNGNSWAWNNSPQTQINKDNVQDLEVKWIFPIDSKATAPVAIRSLALNDGANNPPIVRNGLVYVMTNYFKTYAIEAKTGKQVWAYSYSINLTDVQKRIPVAIFPSGTHWHGIRYWEGGDVILVPGMACDFLGLDAKTGKEKFWVKDLCKNIEGNLYQYRYVATMSNGIGTYEKGRQFFFVLPGYMHTSLVAGDARHVTLGISMDTQQILWKVFSYPPQDRPTKDWALQECDIGWFRDMPCSEAAAKNQAGLEWDWAFPNERPSKWGAVTANWGQPVVDEDTGIVYTNTGNIGPFTNTTLIPGPNLYGVTVMAIDMNKGRRVWWHQSIPHDPYDYDCNWNGILAETKTGKIYIKGCKEGLLYARDAATGKQKWVADVVSEQAKWGQIRAETADPKAGFKYHLPDPTSYYDMRVWGWAAWPTYHKIDAEGFANIYPCWGNGIFATDISYDPETQTVYHYAMSCQARNKSAPYIEGRSVSVSGPIGQISKNVTLVARDANTGEVKWTWFYSLSGARGHVIPTAGMVIAGFPDGQMRFFDKNTGKVLHSVNLGGPLSVGPTIAQDADGKQKIFTMLGFTTMWGGGNLVAPGVSVAMQPGTLVAIGLSERAAKTTTLTTTSTTTTATTTTVTTTAPPTTRTVSTTATSTVTQTVETMGPTTYGAVAVAVIAIIAVAVLTMRKRA